MKNGGVMSDESIERKINNSLLRVQERHLERIKQLEQENAKLKEILEQLIEATEYDVNHWQMAFSPMEETKGQIAIREAKELTNR
jgi:predicted PP-loop superfamily ATPase